MLTCSPMTKNIIIGERGGATGGICSGGNQIIVNGDEYEIGRSAESLHKRNSARYGGIEGEKGKGRRIEWGVHMVP